MRAPLLITALFYFSLSSLYVKGQGTQPEKLHKRLYEHYEQKEIDLFKPVDVHELNWYMTESFVIDKTTVLCNECHELDLDTFDVIRYDKMRLDDQRVIIRPEGSRHPLVLFSKNEVLKTIETFKLSSIAAVPINAMDTTITTCSATFYDPGGPAGNYTYNPTPVVTTFCPSGPGQSIQATFTQWNMSDTYCGTNGVHDALIVFDGKDTNSAWIGNFSTTINIPSNAPSVITSTCGCLTFKFRTDACSPGAAGWTANIACVACPVPIPPQPSCNNVDFETGNFTGWTGRTGTNYASVWNTGFVTNRHTIVSVGNDLCGGFPVSAPGGSFSAKLGNDSIGAQSEQLFTKFQVTTANANFTYQYAAVLQDPGHAFFDQPFFKIEVFNDSNRIVQCGYYYVAAGQGIPGFSPCNGTSVYKPWSFIAVDLVPYIGQNVTIRYTTGDCSRTGHYGYAYIDCTCNPFRLVADSGLCPGASTVLQGPVGFANYSWSPGGQTTQSITVSQPGTYCVSVSQSQNCATNTLCATIVAYPKPTAQFSYTPASPMILEQMPVCFTNLSTISSGSISSYSWNFGDPLTLADTSRNTNPCYAYTAKGHFCVSLTAISNVGCRDTISKCLDVVPDSIFIPNVFTPNGDGKNDLFTFPNIGYKTLHCDIYNRWGNHIFSFDGVKNGWNGDTPSGPASDGVYYYIMTAERLSGKVVSDHGWVQLLRHK